MNKPIFILALADILGIVGILILASGIWKIVSNKEWAQVQTVNVYNINPYMEELKLEAIIKQAMVKGYFNVNVEKLSEALTDVSFVRTAKIVHSWPMAIDVYLQAHQPVAYIIKDGQKLFINNFAETYISERNFDNNLPIISALETDDELLNLQNQKLLIEKLLLWNKQLKNSSNKNYYITRLEITKSLSWVVEFNYRIVNNLGQDNNENIIDKRFLRSLSSLEKLEKDFGNNAKLEVDTRYASSIAVRRVN